MPSQVFKHGRNSGVAVALSAVAVVTAILLPFRDYLNPTEVSLALLLVVLFTSTLFGSRSGLTASVAGILSFNFFFLPPFHTLNIAGPENWVAFGTFIITALIAGQLSGYARRRAEESEERKAEIERLYNELRSAFEQASEAEALRRSEKLKSALLDAVTHDLRTPLTSIKAAVTTLLEEPGRADLDEASRNEFLEIIDEETDRLNAFVEGIVGMAKIESGATQLVRSPAFVDEIIDIAISRAEKQLARHRLEIQVTSGLPALDVDASSVAEVVFTLLDNAAKYSNAGTRVRIAAETNGGSAVDVFIEDEGRGIPAELREKVFDKFYRSPEQNIHSTGSGLGLGLAIARGIVESQAGRIWIEDGREGFVTRVVLRLPTVGKRDGQ